MNIVPHFLGPVSPHWHPASQPCASSFAHQQHQNTTHQQQQPQTTPTVNLTVSPSVRCIHISTVAPATLTTRHALAARPCTSLLRSFSHGI
ncbi:unnamed protein product [Periconia digitata]|uniref:Uncharacterized protein n=1 Tax=Periconia digitata TaxID=1303443 RepID=A0A9W4XSB6_9PLEO|nr:unnamed protein product [Periconia digitata]